MTDDADKIPFANGHFYPPDVTYSYIPDDAILVPADQAISAMNRPAGYTFSVSSNGDVTLIPPVEPSASELAESEKLTRLASAHQAISIWQTKLQLGRITDDEKQKLNLWLDYIDELNAIDTSIAPNISWPLPPQ